MNELINIDDILVRYEVDKICGYVEMLKSIKVINDLYFISGSEEATLYDKIVIDIHSFYIKRDMLKNIFPMFHRIKYDCYFLLSGKWKDLELLEKEDIKINEASFEISNEDEQNILNNSSYLKNKVKKLQYTAIFPHKLTNDTILNLSIIKPKELVFTTYYQDSLRIDFIQILSLWSWDTNIRFENSSSTKISLCFKNTCIKIIDPNKSKSLVYKCKSFTWDLTQNSIEWICL